MPAKSPARRAAASRIAALSRSRANDDAELIDARRTLKAVTLADYIEQTVDAAPPLTPEQRDRLALMLSGGGRVA